jgi:hypothetical protein
MLLIPRKNDEEFNSKLLEKVKNGKGAIKQRHDGERNYAVEDFEGKPPNVTQA